MASFQGNSKDTIKSYTLLKKREKELEELQKKKNEIAKVMNKITNNKIKNLQTTNMSNKFVSYTETLDDELKSNIVGINNR